MLSSSPGTSSTSRKSRSGSEVMMRRHLSNQIAQVGTARRAVRLEVAQVGTARRAVRHGVPRIGTARRAARQEVTQVGMARRAVRQTLATARCPGLVEMLIARNHHRDSSPEPLSKSAAKSPKIRCTMHGICWLDFHTRRQVHIGQAYRKGCHS